MDYTISTKRCETIVPPTALRFATVTELFKQCRLLFATRRAARVVCKVGHGGEALYQRIVLERFGRPVLAFTGGVEAIRQFSCNLCVSTQLGDEHCCGRFTTAVQGADELMHALPYRQAIISGRVPVGGELVGLEQAHFATR